MVHLAHVNTALDDPRIAVPILNERDAWIGEAVETLPKWAFRYVEELNLWLVDPAADRLFTDAVNEKAKRDDRWCGPCVAWAANPSSPLCSVWEELTEGMTEFGFEICHIGVPEMPKAPRPERRFEFPPVIAQIFAQLARDAAQPGSPTNRFVKETASPFLKEQLRKRAGGVFGVVFNEQLLDELLEAAFAAMRGEVPPASGGDPGMSTAQAAEILGCAWPCSAEEITAAFRKKARETHPDAHPNATEAEREAFKQAFVKVGLAREVLTKAVPS